MPSPPATPPARRPGFNREEIGRTTEWWILHRERDPKLADAPAELQAALYSLPAGAFEEHARHRAEAMILRDEGGDGQRIAEVLRLAWGSLHTAVNRPGAGSS